MERTFNLFGDIVENDGARYFDSDVMPAIFVGWIAKQEGDLTININSNGGSVAGGLAIANAIKAYNKGTVTANVIGVAASMASVVACACDRLAMGEGAFLVVHNPWTIALGDADDLRHEAEVLDEMKSAIVGFYQSKCSKSADELAAIMDAETWIIAEKAAEYGFAVEPVEKIFAAAASLTRYAFASAPDAAKKFFSLGTQPPRAASEPAAAPAGEPSSEAAGNQPAPGGDQPAPGGDPADPAAPAAEPAAACDWQARYKGLSTRLNTIQVEHAARVQSLIDQLGALRGDLETAKADLSSATARADKAEQDLADTSEQLAKLQSAHALLTGGVLSPSGELPTLQEGLAKCNTPAEKSAFIASGAYRK